MIDIRHRENDACRHWRKIQRPILPIYTSMKIIELGSVYKTIVTAVKERKHLMKKPI